MKYVVHQREQQSSYVQCDRQEVGCHLCNLIPSMFGEGQSCSTNIISGSPATAKSILYIIQQTHIVIFISSALDNTGVQFGHLHVCFVTSLVGRQGQVGEHHIDGLETLIKVVVHFRNR